MVCKTDVDARPFFNVSYVDKLSIWFLYTTVLRWYMIEAEISPEAQRAAGLVSTSVWLVRSLHPALQSFWDARRKNEHRAGFYVSVGEVELKEGGLGRWNALAGRGGVYDCVIKWKKKIVRLICQDRGDRRVLLVFDIISSLKSIHRGIRNLAPAYDHIALVNDFFCSLVKTWGYSSVVVALFSVIHFPRLTES